MNKVGCPLCGAGVLWKMRIRSYDITSYICDECDLIWKEYSDVNENYGTGSDDILRWLGSKSGWHDFEMIEQVPWPERY